VISNVCSRLIFVSKCPSVLFSGNCTTYILMCKSIKFCSFSLSALERGTSVGPASVRTLALHPFAEHLQERSPDLVSASNLYRKPRLVFNIELWSVWYDWCSVKCWKDLKYLVIIYFFNYQFLDYKIHLQKNHKLHSNL
jgi:hypothetical protein